MTKFETTARVAATAELAAGVLLVAKGPDCWRTVAGSAPAAVAAVASRVLGGRYLVQGLCQLLWPRHLVRTWATIDLLHAATMALVAVRPGLARRPTLLSGAVAATNGLSSWSRWSRWSRQ